MIPAIGTMLALAGVTLMIMTLFVLLFPSLRDLLPESFTPLFTIRNSLLIFAIGAVLVLI